MVRPVRKKRVPKRLDDAAEEKSPVIKEPKRVARGKNESKKTLRSDSVGEKKRSSALKDKTNIERTGKGDEAKKESDAQGRRLRNRQKTEKNESKEEKAEATETETVRSKGSKIEKETRSENKFFKTKRPLWAEEWRPISMRSKNLRKQTEKNDSPGFVAALKQTTLSESFGRLARARLRPRKVVRDYKNTSNTSALLEKSISPDKRNSVVFLERIEASKMKVPVYKTTVNAEPKDEDKDSIYDFRFDSNDPKEKPKKKRIRRIAPKKKPVPISRPKRGEAEKQQTETENRVLGDAKDTVEEVAVENEAVNSPVAAAVESEKGENSPPKDNKAEERSPELRICNVEELTGDRKVSFRPNPSTSRQTSVKFNPFRSTQSIFAPRPTLDPRDMLDHSLLNKSLSPIKSNGKDMFDAASPWRSPVPESFFKVRQAVQSTPQIKRNFGRPSSPLQSLRINDKEENQENTSPQRKLALPMSPTPLGVRTSNAENIQASNPRKILGLSSAGNKQNLKPGFGDRLYISPKKSDKISQKRSVLCAINETPLSPLENTDENIPPMEDSRLLKQSNLNSFLNIDEMPESIRISTSHGIFGDTHSTPIVKLRVPQPQQDNVENFFGFDDDNSSDVQISPIKEKKLRATPVKKIFDKLKGRVFAPKEKNTARISLGEIKNTLYPRREKKIEKNDLAKEEKEAKRCNNNKQTENAVQFSDTFDVMPENEGVTDTENSIASEIALFADIEPVHFTKPARWSYSKKRERKQYWSDEDSDDDDLKVHKMPVLKKRRVAKVNKVEEKKIEDWVKSVNETFQEIDNFDLVVEKLP